MVVTAQNHHEVSDMARLAARLGSAGLRFVHLMPTPETAVRGLDLSPGERRRVEADIWGLRRTAPIAIDMAPGYFHDAPFFPCAPLELEEFNVDYRGNLTLCCQLSGYAESEPDTDLVANLGDVSLMEACQRFRGRVARYLADKQERVTRGKFGMLDYFPCWYCVKYLGKTRPLQRLRNHPWAQASLGSGIEETGT
jgi:MoaA/NifB/PqqE/SkfB family radical SAM enzyme